MNTINIRQAINNSKIESDTALLMQVGILSSYGHLTALGRRVLADQLFEANKDKIVAAVKAVTETVEA